MQLKRGISCTLAFIIGWHIFLSAQPIVGEKSPTPLSNMILEQWTDRNGLPVNKIIAAKQSLDGYIWLVSYDGITRFDGHTFDHFTAANSPELKQNTYYEIHESADSTLWFLSRGEGIIQYKDNKFFDFALNDSIPFSIRTILIDSKNRLWLEGFEQLLMVDKGQLNTIDIPDLSRGNILEIMECKDGSIVFATDGSGLIIYNGSTFKSITKEDGLIEDIIISVEEGNHGEIIVGTFNGVSIIQHNEIVNLAYTSGARVNDITVDDQDNIYLGTDLGLFVIDKGLKSYQQFTENNKLPSREINSVSFDHEGSIWLGLEKGGLVQLKNSKFRTFTDAHGLSLDKINVIAQKNDSIYYVGSDNGDVDILNLMSNKITHTDIKQYVQNKGIRDILFDDEVTWIASYAGLLRIEGSSKKLYTTADGLSSELIRSIYRDSNGVIWLASRSGGVMKLVDNELVKVVDESSGMKSNYVLDIEEHGGKMYFATNRGGVTVLSEDNSIDTYLDYGGYTDVVNFNIRSDKKDRLWLCTSNGLFLIQENSLQRLNIEVRTGANAFFDVIVDDNYNFWITTSYGLIHAKGDEIEKFLSNPNDYAIPIELFDENDGLPTRECTAATKSLKDKSGNVWVPTNAGIALIEPGNIKENNIVPNVYIKGFMIDDEPRNIDHSVVIKPGHIRYRFEFTALSFLAPDGINFKYMLEGLDKDWIYSKGSTRSIEYTNIPPGTYSFKVLASNNDGVWNNKGDTLTIEIEPFIHQTIWFYPVLLFLLILSILLIARWRLVLVKKRNMELQKLNTELDRFVYSTSHDLRAPLLSLLGLINISKTDNDPSYLNMMESSVRKLDDFIKEIIDYSRNARLEAKVSRFNIDELIRGIIQDLEYLDVENNVECKIKVQGSEIVETDEARVKIVLNNIISNALKYIDNSRKEHLVNINIDNTGQQLLIQITDNGIGISNDQVKNIFNMFHRATEKSSGSGIGLYIVKETIDKLKGQIEVQSKPGEGTTFNIHIPKMKSA